MGSITVTLGVWTLVVIGKRRALLHKPDDANSGFDVDPSGPVAMCAGHITDVIRTAIVIYETLSRLHTLPFPHAIAAAYVHDIGKVAKYTRHLPTCH